jgi:hypothetical protein
MTLLAAALYAKITSEIERHQRFIPSGCSGSVARREIVKRLRTAQLRFELGR